MEQDEGKMKLYKLFLQDTADSLKMYCQHSQHTAAKASLCISCVFLDAVHSTLGFFICETEKFIFQQSLKYTLGVY